MRKPIFRAFLSVLACLSTAALVPAQGPSAAAPYPKGLLLRPAVPAGLPGSFTLSLPLDGAVRRIAFVKNDVRAPGYRVLADDGHRLTEVPAGPCRTYEGTVLGGTGGVAAALLGPDGLSVAVRLGNGRLFGLQPASVWNPRAPKGLHVLYAARDLRTPGVFCGVNVGVLRPKGGGAAPAALKVAELAIDADYDFYRRFGSSTTAVQNQVNAVINAVDVIYKRDVAITYKITTVLIRTARVYGSTTSIGTRLGQFRSRWNSVHAGVRRDLAHMFTGVGSFSGAVGIAYLKVVCNLSYAYGVSKAYHRSLTVNAGLVAHEMGHNWGAGHCNSAGADCKIMCSYLGGCGRDMTRFGNTSKNAILAFKNTRTCLSDPAPPKLTGISPAQVPALGSVTVTLTGTGLSGTTKLLVGGKAVVGYKIVSDTSLTFQAPVPTALGPTQVQAGNSSGLSNALSLTYVATHPPRLKASQVGYPNLLPIDYTIGSKPRGLWVLILSGSKQTIPFLGYSLLKNFVVLTAGTLDQVGIGRLRVPVTTSLKGANLYSQAATFKSLQFVGLSNITTTLVY